MTFKKFSKEHIEEARKLALNNYEEERLAGSCWDKLGFGNQALEGRDSKHGSSNESV